MIVSRAQWGARDPRQVNRISTPTQHLVLHYFGTDSPGPQGTRAVQDFHMDVRGWHDIAYSLTADADNVYIARGPGVRGAHTPQWNTRAHAVAAQVDGSIQPDGLLDRLAEAAVWLYQQGAVTEPRYTGGHRDYSSTACPGSWLYARIPEINDRAQALLEDDMQEVDQPDWLPDATIDKLLKAKVLTSRPEREPYVVWRTYAFLGRMLDAVSGGGSSEYVTHAEYDRHGHGVGQTGRPIG